MLIPRLESGFTLIEMLVTMLIAAVVFGLISSTLFAVIGDGSRSSTARRSSQQASEVFDRFQEDVRYAQSPDVLDAPKVGDDLRAMLLWGQSRAPSGAIMVTSPDECGESVAIARRDFCEYEDVTRATSRSLWIRSDVRSASSADAGVECVQWEIRSGALWRDVHAAGPAPDCRMIGGVAHVGALLESRKLLAAPPSAATGARSGDAGALSYLVVWNPKASASPSSVISIDDCTADDVVVSAPAGRQRTFISAVRLDLASVALGAQGSASRTRYTSTAQILGRATDDYVRAAGCAY